MVQPVQFPSQGHPFVGADGRITQPWMQFLLALWNRTGGSPGDNPGDTALLSLLMGVQSDETSVSKTDDRGLAALLQSGNISPQPITTPVPPAEPSGQQDRFPYLQAFIPQDVQRQNRPLPIPVETQPAQDGRRFMQPILPQDAQARNLNGQAAQAQPIEDKNAARNAFVMAFAPRTGEGDSSRNWSVQTVTVGASPFSYKAPSSGFVAIDGGAVSLIEFSRDGTTFISVGTGFGAYPVRKNDFIRTTYSSTPTISFVPM